LNSIEKGKKPDQIGIHSDGNKATYLQALRLRYRAGNCELTEVEVVVTSAHSAALARLRQ
jgi:hypothetical protein